MAISIPSACRAIGMSSHSNLRLSSTLLYGVTLVYKQKIDYFHTDISLIRTRIQRDIRSNIENANCRPNRQLFFLEDDANFDIEMDFSPAIYAFSGPDNNQKSANKRAIRQRDLERNEISQLSIAELSLLDPIEDTPDWSLGHSTTLIENNDILQTLRELSGEDDENVRDVGFEFGDDGGVIGQDGALSDVPFGSEFDNDIDFNDIDLAGDFGMNNMKSPINELSRESLPDIASISKRRKLNKLINDSEICYSRVYLRNLRDEFFPERIVFYGSRKRKVEEVRNNLRIMNSIRDDQHPIVNSINRKFYTAVGLNEQQSFRIFSRISIPNEDSDPMRRRGSSTSIEIGRNEPFQSRSSPLSLTPLEIQWPGSTPISYAESENDGGFEFSFDFDIFNEHDGVGRVRHSFSPSRGSSPLPERMTRTVHSSRRTRGSNSHSIIDDMASNSLNFYQYLQSRVIDDSEEINSESNHGGILRHSFTFEEILPNSENKNKRRVAANCFAGVLQMASRGFVEIAQGTQHDLVVDILEGNMIQIFLEL